MPEEREEWVLTPNPDGEVVLRVYFIVLRPEEEEEEEEVHADLEQWQVAAVEAAKESPAQPSVSAACNSFESIHVSSLAAAPWRAGKVVDLSA